MDREEPFTFEATDSGPASNATGDTAKRDGAGENPSGRIDPAIARATASGAATEPVTTSEPSGPTAPATGDTAPGAAAAGTAPKRGRPKGSTNKERETGNIDATRNVRVSFIEKTLYTIHLGVSAMTQCPELELGKEDAKTLAEATAGVLALYKVRMTPKQEAYGLMLEAVAQVYPPMIFSIWMRKKMEAEQRKKFAPPQPQRPKQTAQPGNPVKMETVSQPGRDFVQPSLNDGVPLQQELPDTPPRGEVPDGFDPGNIQIPK